ncbi:SCO family protein [Oleiharenicola lentus]|uniref:SCO family protein n=1 Tax=Oleiharenicola lentus TaxID=2508720 RepID=UPI003F66CF9E
MSQIHQRAGALFAAAILLGGVPAANAQSTLPRTAEHDYDTPAAGSYRLPVIRAAGDGAVLDATGQTRQLRELTRGKVTIMSFIYTRCASPNACPMATGVLLELNELVRKDATLADKVRLISLSFDPEHDTPAKMAEYAAAVRSESTKSVEWQFLTTASQQNLRPILAAYDQAVDRKDDPADPTGPLNHTLRVFLIDEAGRVRNIYSAGTLDVRLILADIATLNLEQPKR